MHRYIAYIFTNIIKKRTSWITMCLVWLFIILVTIIVPNIFSYTFDFLWNNQMIQIQTFLIILYAIFCATVIVIIFRDPIDDGNELIIFSKPLNRTSIIFSKFFCAIVTSIFCIFISTIIFIIAYATIGGSSDSVAQIISFFSVASIITTFLFSSLAIIISIFSGKIAIISISSGIGIVLCVLHMILPLISTTPAQFIKSKYNYDTLSSTVVGREKDAKAGSDYVRKNIVTLSGNTTDDINVHDIIKNAEDNSHINVASNFDIGGQLISMFNKNISENVGVLYDSDNNFKFSIQNNKLVDLIKSGTYVPAIILPSYSFDSSIPTISYYVGGLGNEFYLVNSLLFTNDTFAFLSNKTNVFNSKALTYDDVNKIDDRNFVNYIVDKYLWDRQGAVKYYDDTDPELAKTSQFRGFGYGANKTDNDAGLATQIRWLLCQKSNPLQKGHSLKDSFAAGINEAQNIPAPINFDKQTGPNLQPTENYHQLSDLNIVLNDESSDKDKYQTGSGASTKYDIGHYLTKALGPYKFNDPTHILEEAAAKLVNLIFERETKMFIGGTAELDKHYAHEASFDYEWDDPATLLPDTSMSRYFGRDISMISSQEYILPPGVAPVDTGATGFGEYWRVVSSEYSSFSFLNSYLFDSSYMFSQGKLTIIYSSLVSFLFITVCFVYSKVDIK